jgi:cytochrome b pre-mRNA-processing protein 3
VSIFRRLFCDGTDRASLRPLYEAVVAEARAPAWYREGRVPDTVDGRFDMIAALLSLVMFRLEAEGAPGRAPAALLTESFIADMDGQLRELGIGDVVVGKHMGKMMGALGGRLDAYRRTIDVQDGGLEEALVRNLYRDVAPPPEALAFVVARLRRTAKLLADQPIDALLAGRVPQP